jgi:hypothetical protein
MEHGEGLAEDSEGMRYEGQFRDGKRHGSFVVKDSTGTVVRTCEYIMGQIKPDKPIEEEKPKAPVRKKKRRK